MEERRKRIDEVGSVWPVAEDIWLETITLDGLPMVTRARQRQPAIDHGHGWRLARGDVDIRECGGPWLHRRRSNRRRDGALIYVDITSKAVRNADGTLAFILISNKDVTHLTLSRYGVVHFSAWRYRRTPEVWAFLYETVLEAAKRASTLVTVRAAGQRAPLR